MANLLLATPALSDAAVLDSPSPVASTLPLTNMQTMRPSKVARFTDPSDVVITVDTGAIGDISLVALLYTNASATATIRVRIADTEGGLTSAPTYDSGVVAMNMPTGNVSSIATVSGRWVRIDVDDPDNPDGFFDIGRLYVANAWVLAINISPGWGIDIEDDSPVALALDGGLLPTPRGQRRVLRATLAFQSEAEMYGQAFATMRARGTARDVLVVRDPDLTTYLEAQTICGLLAMQPVINTEIDVYAWQLVVRELV